MGAETYCETFWEISWETGASFPGDQCRSSNSDQCSSSNRRSLRYFKVKIAGRLTINNHVWSRWNVLQVPGSSSETGKYISSSEMSWVDQVHVLGLSLNEYLFGYQTFNSVSIVPVISLSYRISGPECVVHLEFFHDLTDEPPLTRCTEASELGISDGYRVDESDLCSFCLLRGKRDSSFTVLSRFHPLSSRVRFTVPRE